MNLVTELANPPPAKLHIDISPLGAEEVRLLDALGVGAPLLVCGGSLGGMVTQSFAAVAGQPTIGARLVLTRGNRFIRIAFIVVVLLMTVNLGFKAFSL